MIYSLCLPHKVLEMIVVIDPYPPQAPYVILIIPFRHFRVKEFPKHILEMCF